MIPYTDWYKAARARAWPTTADSAFTRPRRTDLETVGTAACKLLLDHRLVHRFLCSRRHVREVLQLPWIGSDVEDFDEEIRARKVPIVEKMTSFA